MSNAEPAQVRVVDIEAAEGKRDKFIRLAEKRTVNAIKAIRVIGKLGNKSAYDFDDQDVRKIITALTREIEQLKSRLSTSKGGDGVEFRL